MNSYSLNNFKKQIILSFILIIISWCTYTAIGLKIHHFELESNNIMGQERDSIAAAISYSLYHSHFGGLYSEVSKALETNTSLIQTMKTLPDNIKPQSFSAITDSTSDTLLLIYLYSLGMKLFGINANAMFLIFSLFLLVSHLTYVLRFNDYRAIFAPISLLSLNLLYFTPFVTNFYIANQVFIPGFRYITVLAILPTLHILLEICDSKRPLNLLSHGCLIIQATIIGLCSFEKSGIYTFLSIFLFSVTSLLYLKNHTKLLQIVIQKLLFISAILIVFYGMFYLTTPSAYRNSHQVGDIAFWHRIWISFGVNPNWPFKEIEKQYGDCANAGEPGRKGLHHGIVDWNARCVWYKYIEKHPNINPYMRANINLYESTIRTAVLKLLFQSPKNVFLTLFYYKPRFVFYSAQYDLNYTIPIPDHKFQLLLPLTISIFILVLSCFFYLDIRTNLYSLCDTYAWILLSILAMYIVAFGSTSTILELIFSIQTLILLSLVMVFNFIKNMRIKG